MEDPEFLREYVRESIRIAMVDAIMNALDDARLAEGLSKAKLARHRARSSTAGFSRSATVPPNPTLGTLVEVATALGLRIRVEPLPDEERQAVTEPLRTGTVAKAGLEKLVTLRRSTTRAAVRPG